MAAGKTKQKEVDILWQLKNKAERSGWKAGGRQRWIAGGLEGQVAE